MNLQNYRARCIKVLDFYFHLKLPRNQTKYIRQWLSEYCILGKEGKYSLKRKKHIPDYFTEGISRPV